MKPKFIIDNQQITNRRVIANEFNRYFVSLAPKLNDPDDHCIINIEPIQPFTAFLKQSNISSIYLSECTSYEISELISGLENSKASDIPIKIIKRSSHIISPLLASHFNESMSKGIFPDILKVGKITPIYKKDNPELLENYRPVSTLPIFGKIFEKVNLWAALQLHGITKFNDFLPIWFSERSFNQPCAKLFYKPYPRSTQKEKARSGNIHWSK